MIYGVNPLMILEFLGGGIVIIDEYDEFIVTEHSREIARVPGTIEVPKEIFKRRLSMCATFKPPAFGVTVLGSSHGFDQNHNTTGFVLWVNGRGNNNIYCNSFWLCKKKNSKLLLLFYNFILLNKK